LPVDPSQMAMPKIATKGINTALNLFMRLSIKRLLFNIILRT